MSIDIFLSKCQIFDMKDSNADPKQNAIVTSAWQAFATYGFRKTSMDDIARGAGMSRPALYQHYRNKEDIFRSLVQHHYDEARVSVRDALQMDGSVIEVLTNALQKQSEGAAELLMSPHGMELLDAGSTTAPDIVEAGEAALQVLYAEWLERQVARGSAKLPGEASVVAAMLTTALKGIKSHAPDVASYTARVQLLGALAGAGLSVR